MIEIVIPATAMRINGDIGHAFVWDVDGTTCFVCVTGDPDTCWPLVGWSDDSDDAVWHVARAIMSADGYNAVFGTAALTAGMGVM